MSIVKVKPHRYTVECGAGKKKTKCIGKKKKKANRFQETELMKSNQKVSNKPARVKYCCESK